MPYNENEIKAQLSNLSAEVDTDQLWNDIRHHAPIRKSRKWLPLCLMFALGGVLSAATLHFFFQHPCVPNEDRWMGVIDSLTSQNKHLEEKLMASTFKVDSLVQDAAIASQMKRNNNQQWRSEGNRPILFEKALQKSQNVPESPSLQTIESASNEPSPTHTAAVSQSTIPFLDIDKISFISPVPLVSNHVAKGTNDAIMPKIYTSHDGDLWQYHFGITSGASVVDDSQLDGEGNQRHTRYSPYLSYAVELGLSRKIKGRFAFGALLNYSNMIYRLNYHQKLVENINLIDTTEISISSNGVENVVIGNTGGIKITEQKGKVHGYQHRVSIIPTFYYQSLARGKFHLCHDIGLGVDVLDFSKNIIPTYDSRSFLAQQVKGLVFKPYLRIGTQVDYRVSKDLQAALLLRCTYRNENYNFSSFNGNRSSIFPSIGVGLTFM